MPNVMRYDLQMMQMCSGDQTGVVFGQMWPIRLHISRTLQMLMRAGNARESKLEIGLKENRDRWLKGVFSRTKKKSKSRGLFTLGPPFYPHRGLADLSKE